MAELNKIVSIDDIKNNLKEVQLKLNKLGEIIVIENNEPVFVMKSVEEEKRYIEIIVEGLLQKVGKSVFIEYYEMFEKDERPEQHLPAKFSLNSRRSRSSAARKIFEGNYQILALEIILESNRLENSVLSKTRELLSSRSTEVQIKTGEFKIGYIVKNIFPLLIESGNLDNLLAELVDASYSKEQFGIYYPLLKEIEFVFDSRTEKYDHNKYSRYYSKPISRNGKDYLLCSQWSEKLNYDKLISWINNTSKDLGVELESIISDYLR